LPSSFLQLSFPFASESFSFEAMCSFGHIAPLVSLAATRYTGTALDEKLLHRLIAPHSAACLPVPVHYETTRSSITSVTAVATRHISVWYSKSSDIITGETAKQTWSKGLVCPYLFVPLLHVPALPSLPCMPRTHGLLRQLASAHLFKSSSA